MSTTDYKKLRSYRISRVFYIFLCLLMPVIVLYCSYRWCSLSVGLLPMHTDFLSFFILSTIFFIFGTITLILIRRLVIDLFFLNNRRSIYLLMCACFIIALATGALAAYFRDSTDKYLSDEYFKEDTTSSNCYINPTSTSEFKLECITTYTGKPVIYLYPLKEMDVNVKVKPVGGFTITDPKYPTDGWLVHANPNGELLNYSDNKKYPYLFWEGYAYENSMKPKEGFVIKKEEVRQEMEKLLALNGLNKKETGDFLDFWADKLSVKPYVFISFVDKSVMDKIAPITIVPNPDTVVRVFIDYIFLDEPILVEPQIFSKVERSGFTVVEWGGALYK